MKKRFFQQCTTFWEETQKSDDIPLARSIECPCVLCYHEIKTFYILIIQRLIMIYHYEFALSSFVVLILLCILSLRREYLPIRRNRFFRMLLGMEGLTLVFDILSSEMDAHRAILSGGGVARALRRLRRAHVRLALPRHGLLLHAGHPHPVLRVPEPRHLPGPQDGSSEPRDSSALSAGAQ